MGPDRHRGQDQRTRRPRPAAIVSIEIRDPRRMMTIAAEHGPDDAADVEGGEAVTGRPDVECRCRQASTGPTSFRCTPKADRRRTTHRARSCRAGTPGAASRQPMRARRLSPRCRRTSLRPARRGRADGAASRKLRPALFSRARYRGDSGSIFQQNRRQHERNDAARPGRAHASRMSAGSGRQRTRPATLPVECTRW